MVDLRNLRRLCICTSSQTKGRFLHHAAVLLLCDTQAPPSLSVSQMPAFWETPFLWFLLKIFLCNSYYTWAPIEWEQSYICARADPEFTLASTNRSRAPATEPSTSWKLLEGSHCGFGLFYLVVSIFQRRDGYHVYVLWRFKKIMYQHLETYPTTRGHKHKC